MLTAIAATLTFSAFLDIGRAAIVAVPQLARLDVLVFL